MSRTATANEPTLPEAKMHLVMPGDPVTGRVVSNTLCLKGKSASFVRHVAIDVSGTPLAGSFRAGQSFGVIPPGLDQNGKPNRVRLYSISCPTWGEDGQGNVISTTPKRLLDERRPQKPGDDPDDHRLFVGTASNYLCDLRPGDEIRLSGPNGKRFLLPTDTEAHDYLFLATGTGIAPFRGMAMELFDETGKRPNGPTRSRVELVMGTPYTTDLLYDELFTELAAKHSNFGYHPTISRERRPDGSRGRYVHQFLHDELQDRIADRISDRLQGRLATKTGGFRDLLASPRTLIYICGLAGMQVGLFQTLAMNGLAAGYLTVADQLATVDPASWTEEQIKRRVRSNSRCMLEVY
ncbi:MAG: hypothetical protein U0575_05580 [Phycisphaerales bacterium]